MEEQGSRTEHRRIELGGRELQDGDGPVGVCPAAMSNGS